MSFISIKCNDQMHCQSNQSDYINVDIDPLEQIENLNNYDESNQSDIDLESERERHYRYQKTNSENYSNDTFSTDMNQLANSKVYNSSNCSTKRSRKRLLSLQTSYEEESSESYDCNSCNCTVTEVTRLGNGIIKRTVYRYDIQTSQETV